MSESELQQLKKETDEILGSDKEFDFLLSLKKILQENIPDSSGLSISKKKEFEQLIKQLEKVEKTIGEKNENIQYALIDILKQFKQFKVNIPKRFDVNVLNQTTYPQFPSSLKVNNFPKDIKINNLRDYTPDIYKFESLLLALLKQGNKKEIKVNLDEYLDSKRPLAVRLSDGKKFYKALLQAFTSGGGGVSFAKSNGDVQEGLIDSDRHVQVDVLSTPESAVSATPTDYNIDLTLADTEYSQALPVNTEKFEFWCRGAYDIRFAFITGKVATPTASYLTLKAGTYAEEDNLNLAATTLYLACGTAAQIVELLVWT